MSINYTAVLGHLEPSALKSKDKITFNIINKEVKETKLIWTSDIKASTVINMNGKGFLSKTKPMTVHSILKETVEQSPNHVAMKYKFTHDEKYLNITFGEYYRLACMTAKSFIKLGLEPHHSVCIAGFNSPPWIISYIGTIFAAGVSSGVYATNTSETIVYILNNCFCQIAVVENTELLVRYLKVSDQIPQLKALIQFQGKVRPEIKKKWTFNIYDWEEFITLGKNISDNILVERLDMLIPNQCCSLIYTSGTTGTPKGVMMSHDNLTWTAKVTSYYMKFRNCKEEVISYLPLSHVAAQMCDIFVPIICQSTVTFAMPDALKGTLGRSIKEVRPTYFVGVPRVWEKISEQMKEIGIGMSATKKTISTWAKDVGLRTNLAIMNKEPTPYGYTIAKMLIYSKIRTNLGFDRCHRFLSSAAPMCMDILNYFASVDIIICEIYGLSECSGPHSVGFVEEFVLGTVGKIFQEFDNKFDNKIGNNNEGEICISGRHVFMGYIGSVKSTTETFDSDNWYHTGDLGTINKDGYVTITGRIKELIITAGGENIAPVPIEDKVKDGSQIISNAMVIGDRKKFLSILLTIKCELNVKNQCASDILTPAAKRWCKTFDYNVEHVSQVISDKHPVVWAAIDKSIKDANKIAASRAAFVHKWIFLPCDFSTGGGELGPTMKVKRGVVIQMYSSLIDKLYEN